MTFSQEDFSIAEAWHWLKGSPLDEKTWTQLLMGYSHQGFQWQAAYVLKQLSRIKNTSESAVVHDLELGMCERFDVVDAILVGSVPADGLARSQQMQTWLHHCPGDWLSWLFLARLLDMQKADPLLRQQSFGQAQVLEPITGESAHLLGGWRLKSGDAVGAVTVLSTLAALKPVRHGSMIHLGEALLRVGNTQAAEAAFTRASHSLNPGVLAWLADVVYRNNYWQESLDVLQKACTLAPTDVRLWLTLARQQSQVYHLDECRQSLAKIQRLDEKNAEAALLKMGLLGQQGDAKGYLQSLRAYFDGSGKKHTRLVSSILMTALYQDDWTAEDVAQLHGSLTADLECVHASSLMVPRAKAPRGGKIRVGYVTGDLHRQHPVNIFMLPLLQQQKAAASVEVYIYHTGTLYDHYTASAKACADVWVDAAAWDDAALHRQIVNDEVDVLLDLAGHTASHRLGVFVKRAAAVQATFLGYPHSTGLKCMDFLIGDPVVSPPEQEHLFSEKVVRLNGPVFCWAPVDNYPLPESQRRAGPVVFGSFNNALKLSPRTVELWANILQAVPDAQLLLKAPAFKNAQVCDRFRSLFAQHAIDAHRLVFRGPTELGDMMQEYGDIDIALDPLSYNGGTTSLQALWMGVPLVTWCGANFSSRMGASFLSVLGKFEWIAQDLNAYVEIARHLALDVDAIRTGRKQFRQHMHASPLCDIQRYASDFERVLRQMIRDSAAS